MENVGILDILGEFPNPLTGTPYSEKYKEYAKKWSKLPAYKSANKIMTTLKENNVILVESGTGSGKTVLIPKFLLHILNYKGKIAITLPKKVVAKTAAEYAALTLDVDLGRQVGYQFRGESKKSQNTNLLYATDGTIKAQLLNDKLLSNFDAVIIDEAHERKIQIDFLLYLLKSVLKERPEFKLIIMSATVNANIFSSYYSDFKFAKLSLEGEPNYEITSIFLKTDLKYSDVILSGLNLVKLILNIDKDGDIIFFVTSQNECVDTCKEISVDSALFCTPLHSGTSNKDKEIAQSMVLYKDLFKKDRKLVVATNVAESSLTIDGLRYVIDSGYEIASMYDPKIRAKVLVKRFITMAQAKQRMGRTGRTGPGFCYHLYTEDTFNKFRPYPDPEIKVTDLFDDSLQLLSQLKTVKNLIDTFNKFIEPPEKEFIVDAITKLEEYGLITDDAINSYGQLISDLHIDTQWGISLYYAVQYNCANELLILISFFEVIKNNLSDLFVKVDDKMLKKFMLAKKSLGNKYGDHMTLIRIFNSFKKSFDKKKLDEWCFKYFIKKNVILAVLDVLRRKKGLRYKIEKSMQTNQNILKSDIRVLYCIAMGLRINVALKGVNDDEYRTELTRGVQIDQNSFCNYYNKPKKVMYNELFNSNGKSSLNMVSRYPSKLMRL
jgi:HrpA-like RNA helicase